MKKSENEKGKTKRRKKWLLWILAGLLLIIVLGVGWLWITQGNNLKALYLAMKNDPDTLEQMQQEQSQKRDELLEEYGLTKPDSEEIDEETGSLPEEGSNTSQSTEEKPNSNSSNQSDDQQNLQEQLQQEINRLYSVEAKYHEMLNGIIAQTKQEFQQLPAEQRTQSNKVALVKSKADELIAKEKQCDAEVNSILSEIRGILKKMGKSDELADEIDAYYQDSKASWKAAKMTELYR